jgi:hypothetical protein
MSNRESDSVQDNTASCQQASGFSWKPEENCGKICKILILGLIREFGLSLLIIIIFFCSDNRTFQFIQPDKKNLNSSCILFMV